MRGLGVLGFNWWNPWIFLLALGVTLVYLAAVGPWRHRFIEGEVVPLRKKAFFVTGILIFYLVLGSPLTFIAHHYLFSVHMIQQSLLYLVMPPLILLGLPAWLVRPLWWRPLLEPLLSLITHPLIAIVLFNLLFSLYHVPIIFDRIMTNSWLTLGSYFVLILTAFGMWWPILSPVPELDRMSPLQKMVYLFVDSILLTPVCAVILFSGGLMYQSFAYLDVPPGLLLLTPLGDQQAAGIVMKVVQELTYGIFLGYTFFHWVRRERKKDAAETSSDSIFYSRMKLDPD